MMGKQRLVGGDHILPGAKRGLDRLLGDTTLAADQLDEDVDPGIAGELYRVGDEAEAGEVGAAVLAPVARRHGHDLDRPADGFGEGYVRIALVENEQRIRQAARNIRKFLAESAKSLHNVIPLASKATRTL